MTTEGTIKISGYQITTLVSDERWCQNCYVVRHNASGEQVVIDPGGDAQRILRVLVDQGENLKMILVTHAHHDHVGAAADLYARYGVPCLVQKGDARLMRQAPMYALVFAGQKLEPFSDFELYDDLPTLGTERQRIRVLYTPGHTAGSVCLEFSDFVFTGDTLLYQHVGRSDTPGASAEQLKASIGRLLEALPQGTRIFPGHGRAWTIGEARAWWEKAKSAPPVYQRFGAL